MPHSAQATAIAFRILQQIGQDPDGIDAVRLQTECATAEGWLRRGFSADEIFPVVDAMLRRNGCKPPRTLRYFSDAIAQYAAGGAGRTTPVSSPPTETSADDDFDDATEARIREVVRILIHDGGFSPAEVKAMKASRMTVEEARERVARRADANPCHQKG